MPNNSVVYAINIYTEERAFLLKMNSHIMLISYTIVYPKYMRMGTVKLDGGMVLVIKVTTYVW